MEFLASFNYGLAEVVYKYLMVALVIMGGRGGGWLVLLYALVSIRKSVVFAKSERVGPLKLKLTYNDLPEKPLALLTSKRKKV